MNSENERVLKNFMEEFFPFEPLFESGFFTQEMRENYQLQAKRVCDYFGFDTVYRYRSEDLYCHISYAGERPAGQEEFVTLIPNIYE